MNFVKGSCCQLKFPMHSSTGKWVAEHMPRCFGSFVCVTTPRMFILKVRSREGFRELVGRTTCFGQQMYAYRSFGLFGEAKVRNALAFCVTPGCICCAEAAVVLLRPFLVDVVRLRLRHYR
jgi:hypothetical protein